MSYKMRKPMVKNKYNLTIKQLKKYKVADKTHARKFFEMATTASGGGTMKTKIELYRDSFQNFKRYTIPRAQLVIADIPYNIGNDFLRVKPYVVCWRR